MKKTEELRSKFDVIFDKNLTEVDNWNSAVFYSDKQKFINELLEAIDYAHSCEKLNIVSHQEYVIKSLKNLKKQYPNKTDYRIVSNCGTTQYFIDNKLVYEVNI